VTRNKEIRRENARRRLTRIPDKEKKGGEKSQEKQPGLTWRVKSRRKNRELLASKAETSELQRKLRPEK